MYYNFFKRFFDILGAIIGLIIASPVIVLTAIVLAIVNRGSPFFLQPRPGRNGKIFNIVKFKTMNDKRDKNGDLLPDCRRTHKAGKLVRSTSIDELPQMINVLRGDMSFIGPRPLLVKYLPFYTTQQARRHNIRPGITGWAQVNGRNTIAWEQKFAYDVWYINHVSLCLDLKIIAMTLKKIVIREGVNSTETTTMIPFDIHCRQLK